jgi:SagB-type dehydrogenase family enzyme
VGHLLLTRVQVALRPGVVRDERAGGRLVLRLGPIAVAVGAGADRALLARLVDGVGEDEAAGDATCALLRDAALLDRVVALGEGGVVRVQPLARRFRAEEAPMPEQLVAAPHAVARFGPGALVVEQPAAAVRVRVEGSAVAAAAALLAGERPARAEALAAELWAAGVLAGEADAGPGPADAWEPHDLLLHARSRLGATDGPFGGTWRRGGGAPAPPALWPPAGAVIELPPAAPLPRGRDVFAVIGARRSTRDYGAAPADLGALATLLHVAARVRGRVDARGWEATDRPYPSGGRAYELELFLAVARCDGLAPGLYRYLPDRHALEDRAAPPEEVGALLAVAGQTMGGAPPPPVLVVLAARMSRISYKYESIAYSLVLKHVGVLQQTLALAAEGLGLGTCLLGGGDSERFARAAGVHPLAVAAVGELALGPLPGAHPQPLQEVPA